jgi:hypothetical protein
MLSSRLTIQQLNSFWSTLSINDRITSEGINGMMSIEYCERDFAEIILTNIGESFNQNGFSAIPEAQMNRNCVEEFDFFDLEIPQNSMS